MLIGILLFILSLAVLIRYSMVIAGLLKGPVLETFEQYGNEDPVYYPWPQILGWLGLMVMSVGTLTSTSGRTFSTANVIGLAFWFMGWMMYTFRRQITAELDALPHVPLWLDKLSQNTGRYERRRIAYMWLRLPLRTRLLYNANGRLFFQWAELVIMATVRDG